jgi:hypothetical protein
MLGRTGLLALALATAGSGCATKTGLARTDVLARPEDAPFRKALVVAMHRQTGTRERLEGALVEALRRRGTEAVAASSYFDLSLRPPSRDEVRELVEREGADTVLVARIEPRGTDRQPVPLTAVGVPLFRQPLGFYDYYWRAWPHVYTPSFSEPVPLGSIEVRLYETGPGARLVFRASSEEFALRDAERAIENVSGLLAERLVRDDLVASAR